MIQPNTEKEKLLMIFSEMNDQLAGLETILRKSFSDLRKDLIRDEEEKLTLSDKKISLLENQFQKREDVLSDEVTNYSLGKKSSSGLKFELGF